MKEALRLSGGPGTHFEAWGKGVMTSST